MVLLIGMTLQVLRPYQLGLPNHSLERTALCSVLREGSRRAGRTVLRDFITKLYDESG